MDKHKTTRRRPGPTAPAPVTPSTSPDAFYLEHLEPVSRAVIHRVRCPKHLRDDLNGNVPAWVWEEYSKRKARTPHPNRNFIARDVVRRAIRWIHASLRDSCAPIDVDQIDVAYTEAATSDDDKLSTIAHLVRSIADRKRNITERRTHGFGTAAAVVALMQELAISPRDMHAMLIRREDMRIAIGMKKAPSVRMVAYWSADRKIVQSVQSALNRIRDVRNAGQPVAVKVAGGIGSPGAPSNAVDKARALNLRENLKSEQSGTDYER